jgi:hypothetical protein
MAKVDPPPDDEELKKRREPKFIIDPKDVAKKDDSRARAWAAELMSKHERFFTDKIPDGRIIARGDVEPEAIDVRNIYPFPNLNWIIFRRRGLFHLMLLSGHRLLFTSSFAKI